MASGHPAPPPNAARPLKSQFDRAVEQGFRGEDVLGERLLLLGWGPVPVTGSVGAAVGLDRAGTLVLVVAVPALDDAVASEIADQLERMAQMTEQELANLRTTSIEDDVRTEHARAFRLDPTEQIPRLNHAQRVKVMVGSHLSSAAWTSLAIQIGMQLDGVYLATDKEPLRISPPAKVQPRRNENFVWAPRHWVGLAGFVLGIGVILLALWRALDPVEPVIQTVEVGFSVEDVVVDAPAEATNTNGIGQRRVFKTNNGRLLVVYRTQDGLQIVQDHRNNGRSWRTPTSLGGLEATSFSATLDEGGNVHLAFTRGSEVAYALVRPARTGWEVAAQTPLDTDGNEVVDIAWDEEGQRAHVVWAETTDAGQEAQWASIAAEEDAVEVAQTEVLAPAEGDVPVLVNIVATLPSQVIATYRSSGSETGWFSRTATGTAGQYEWAPEERLPTDSAIGAASLAHAAGVTHLILGDASDTRLLYFRRSGRSGWSTSQIAVEADSVDEIDLPVVSADSASRLVYVFYQTDRLEPDPQIHMAVRDPTAGWEGPYQTASATDIPDGASYPAAPEVVAGQALVLWTRGGTERAMQAARVTAP